MNDGKRQIKAKETWVKCFEELGSVSKAARKCGIPRSTLYRWIKRCNTEGKDCLKGRSKRPRKLAKQKINDDLEQLIQSIRSTYNFGPQRIHIHLLRVHHIDLSSATIWRVLKKHHTPAIKNIVNTVIIPAIADLFLEIGCNWMLQKLELNATSLQP